MTNNIFFKCIVAFFVFIIISCDPHNNYPSAQEISLYPLDRPIPMMPIEFNLASGEFSEKEVAIIRSALTNWENFSSNKVSFILNESWEPVQEFNQSFYETYPINTIWMKTGDENEIAKMFLKYSITADGFAVGNFIVIINQFQKMTEQRLYMIMMHEIGHKLGMEHIKNDYPALMNLGGNNGKFSIYDKIMFCELYKCQLNSN